MFKERDPWTENPQKYNTSGIDQVRAQRRQNKNTAKAQRQQLPWSVTFHVRFRRLVRNDHEEPSRNSRLPAGELAHIMHGKKDPTRGWEELCDEQLDLTDCKSGAPCSCLCVGPEVFESGSRKSPRLRESSRTARITGASFEKHDFATSRSCLTSPC